MQISIMSFWSNVIFFFLVVLGLHCFIWAFSGCREHLLLSSHGGIQACHCSGFSYFRAEALGVWTSVVSAHGLSSCGSWAQEGAGFNVWCTRSIVVAHGLSSCSEWA